MTLLRNGSSTRWPLYHAGGGTHHGISCSCCHQSSGESCNVEQVSFDPHVPPRQDPHPLHGTPQIQTWLPGLQHFTPTASPPYELSLPSFLYQPPSKTAFPPNVLASAKFRKEHDLLTFFILKCRLLLSLHPWLADQLLVWKPSPPSNHFSLCFSLPFFGLAFIFELRFLAAAWPMRSKVELFSPQI